MLLLMNEFSGDVKKNIVSIPVISLLVRAILFSNSKSAGFLRPLIINSILFFLQKSTVSPLYDSILTLS